MSMNLILSDLRSGRQTWRVLVLVCAPSFAAAFVAAWVIR